MATSSKKAMMSLLIVTVVSLTAFSALARREPAAPRQGKLSPHADPQARARVNEAYGKLPLSFESNQGQADKRVKFLSRGSGYTLFLTSTEAVLSLAPIRNPQSAIRNRFNPKFESGTPKSTAVLHMKLVGANPEPQAADIEELHGKITYFNGSDTEKWQAVIPTYSKVKFEDVYPGVDLVYYGNQRQLEYDFVVAPGAKHNAIELAFEGADKLEIDPEGNLVIGIDGLEVVQHAPVVYQEIDSVRRAIPSRYELRDGQRVGFELEPYDTRETLVIDPMLVYSTYLGATGHDYAWAIAVDLMGFAYVTGQAWSGFPTTSGAYDTNFNGGGSYGPDPDTDVFVTKLNPQGNTLAYSTFIGGSRNEVGLGIALDGDGLAYVTGWTTSGDFPTTSGAYDRNQNGGYDTFVTKLNSQGSALGYSTFLGGSSHDTGSAIDVNSQGIAYVAGFTGSSDFPTTNGAYDRSHNGTLDGFVTKLNAMGSALGYSTFIGGNGFDYINDIAEEADLVYVTGQTNSSNFPTTPGAYDTSHNGLRDVFVTKLNALGTALGYSTFVGHSQDEEANAIVVTNGVVSVTGWTLSASFPTTMGAYDRSHNGGTDAFLFSLNAMGTSLAYSTFLGGSCYDEGEDILVDSAGLTYVTGSTCSTNFPLANPIQMQLAGGNDVFVTKFNGERSGLAFSTF